MTEPTTLAKLYFELSNLCHWRVRNVETLEDYCILWPKSFTDGKPQWFQAINLDQGSLKVELSGGYKMYALLSSAGESTVLSQMKESDMRRVLRESYDNVRKPASPYRLAYKKHEDCAGLWAVDDPAAP
jgi:hypothetical protein